jgi:hypothetical protein
VRFLIGGEIVSCPNYLLQPLITIFKDLPLHTDNPIPMVHFHRATLWRWRLVENYLLICYYAQKSIGWALCLAAGLYAAAKTPQQANTCVFAAQRMFLMAQGPIRPVMHEAYGCWEVWRGINTVYEVMRDGIALYICRHFEKYWEEYAAMWKKDTPARLEREKTLGRERGICARAFEDEPWWWQTGMETHQLEMELGMSRQALIPNWHVLRNSPWHHLGGGFYRRTDRQI